ncbi:DsrE family protein [Herbaspirillum sp. AP02]|uniref:DsrE family protein n=1 Tax=unclassified Herbaspirillum TaxID=2624150 RepID=UPI0015DB756E|nr:MULTISPECIES: DsrE family protein [unclassified Herbaspirillum]MBG7621142.1 DsrE family protein [Herbaspirillum sp. AP02]NZD68871.1 DsrE family protein [Herbaspirillum sp. AP21]
MNIILRSVILALSFHASLCLAEPAAAASSGTSANACTEHYDIVIGVSDKEKLELALSNAQNLQAELGAACANIEIVNFSAAVTLLGPMSPKATLLKDAIAQGVKIIACQNSMNKFKMTEDDLLPGISTVPSGAAEIVRLQKLGWTYLRP